MVSRYMLLAGVLALLLIVGCKERAGSGATGQGSATRTTAAGKAGSTPHYPIGLSARPHHDVSESVKQAWFLVETAYFVISTKWAEANRLLNSGNAADVARGTEMKSKVTAEIERNIFGVNEQVEGLFKSAISSQPDNPLNMASYAYYLRARKRFEANSDNYKNTENEALEKMDQAIKLWPDEWSFYMMKAFILNEPLFCHEWFRATALEEMVIEERLPQIRELCTQAEQYYPQNAFINYYKAQVLIKWTAPEKFNEIRDELLREIKAGNAKDESDFFFFPPLSPIMSYGIKPVLSAGLKEAQYVDFWQQQGHIDPKVLALLTTALAQDMRWPQDKEDIAELMFFLYNVGKTEPRDRSVFSLQSQVLQPISAKLKSGSPEALKFADLSRFLNSQYNTTAQTLFDRRLITDRTKIDVVGIAEAELRNSRVPEVYMECQGREAAYLKRAGEILGLEFRLPEDPAKW